MRRDTDKSVLLCFQETSSESGPQFSQGSLMGLKRVPQGWRGRSGCWVGSGGRASQHPMRALRAGASRERWAPPHVSCARELVPRVPRPQSLLGALRGPRLPTGRSLRVPPPFPTPSLRCFFFLLLGTELRRAEQFALLFPLHAPVLEPDLDLPLGQAQGVRDLDAPPPRQVAIVVKLFLQLQRLVARVGLAAASAAGPKGGTCYAERRC